MKNPPQKIEVDVNKIKKIASHPTLAASQFTFRVVTEINFGFQWYDIAFPINYVICDTKVFVSVSERKGTCSDAGRARLNVYNVAPADGLVSVMINLDNTGGSNVLGQIDFLLLMSPRNLWARRELNDHSFSVQLLIYHIRLSHYGF